MINTLKTADAVAIPHSLNLLLNPYNSMSYLRHTHEADDWTTYHLEIITILPSKLSRFNRINLHPMMRTTTHTSFLVSILPFPAESTQHQLSIMTLATHLLLSIPIIIETQQSWNTIQKVGSHQHTNKEKNIYQQLHHSTTPRHLPTKRQRER